MPLPLPNVFKESRFAKRLLRPIWVLFKDMLYANKVPVHSIISTVAGEHTEPHHKRLCLFVTYDPHSMIDSMVTHYVKSIQEAEFDIIVISSSPELPNSESQKLKPYCRYMIHRKNWGYDFGSWKTTIDWLGEELFKYDQLLLANDSIFGPFSDFTEVMDRIERLDADVCGLSENLEYGRHLQSFFLYLKDKAFHSDAFAAFWDRVRFIPDKFKLIQMYEIGFSRHFRNAGFELKALAEYDTVRRYFLAESEKNHQFHSLVKHTNRNQTLYLWDLLIKDFQIPFIKTDVLKRNTAQSMNVKNWTNFIPAEGRHLIKPIQDRLERIGQKAPDLE